MTKMNWEYGSEADFERLLERFSSFIQMHIQKFDPQKNGIDPEDISQEIRIKIWQILKDEKKIKNYSSYIRKIVDSTVIDQLRRKRRQEGIIIKEKLKRISEQQGFYTMRGSTEKIPSYTMGRALDSLMKSRQKVVRLFLLNMTLEEIAISLNWSKDKTRNLLYRGLSDLKKSLIEQGINDDNLG
jgi:RNA polymerase sigma-70 factor (ECF subfamily)